MPLESWKYTDIDHRYPQITGYTGYFTYEWCGWSGIMDTVEVPKDGEWHPLQMSAKVPEFDKSERFAVPIVGMTLEHSTRPAAWEIRGLKMTSPKSGLAFSDNNWQPTNSCTWSGDGVAKFDYQGERAWVKLRGDEAKKLAVKAGDTVTLSFEAKWVSGDDKIGLAFDFISKDIHKGFGPDDDTSYQIVALHTLETRGVDISCKDIGAEWCDHLPDISNMLAEGLALERMKKGVTPPKSGEHPIGEAIGGQMKGEIWGLVCPGRLDLAAEYARRDGVVAHFRNGVYGEQFIAAMTSAAFYESDVRKLIDAGLSVIPGDSRYAGVIKEVIAWHEKYPDWHDTRRELLAKYPDICNPVYAEAGIVTLALLYGGGDFDKSLGIAASCGNDTDCNCASVGALLGCVKGADAIPAKWKDPIGDEFRCFVKGQEQWKISDLSKRICTAGRRVLKYHGDSVKFYDKL